MGMIVSQRRKLLICSPVKTGTESLQSALLGSEDFVFILPKHTVHGKPYPVFPSTYRRILIVRDPYDRLRSMYTYSVAHGGTKGVSFATKHCRDNRGNWCSFAEFLRLFRDKITSKTWRTNQTDIAEDFQPTEVWKLENLDAKVADEFKIVEFRRRNVSANKGIWRQCDPNANWTKENVQTAAWFNNPDCKTFDYPRRRGTG